MVKGEKYETPAEDRKQFSLNVNRERSFLTITQRRSTVEVPSKYLK